MLRFDDVFLPAIRKRTSRPVILIADNFGTHDSTDTTLQDQQVKWVLLPPNCTSVHQPMNQGIIAALKRKYKSKMLHAMVKNLERYDELQAGGAAIAAGVRGLHAYPPNLLDDATIAHKVWESIDQSTLLAVKPQTRMGMINLLLQSFDWPVHCSSIAS